jgi:prophage regulatory protein
MGRFLSLKQVCEEVGCHRTTLWRFVKKGTFPKPSCELFGRPRWRKAVVEDWLAKQERAYAASAR